LHLVGHQLLIKYLRYSNESIPAEHLGDLDIDGRAWAGLIWLVLGTNWWLLWTW